jgi:undecaprenyl-diphosphatase
MLDGVTERIEAEPADQVPTDRSRAALDALAATISAMADYGVAVVLVEGIAVVRSKRTPARAAARLATVGFSVLALNTVLKRTVGRPRPEGADTPPALARIPRSASFPSGHTMAAATAAVAIPTTSAGIGIGLACAGAVGWSRLRLGAHHGSDVAGGLGIGIAVGTLLRVVLGLLERRS